MATDSVAIRIRGHEYLQRVEVFLTGFQMFDLVFVAIALWQAYKMPAPFKLDTDA